MVDKILVSGRPRLSLGPSAAVPKCPGCTHTLVGKLVLEALDELDVAGKAVCAPGIGCHTALALEMNIDFIHSAHGPAPAVATGAKHAHFGETLVFTIQGDGDCAAIGAGYLLNAAARAENITVIMLNNAVFGTTGGQKAPTTLLGQVTPTSPLGKTSAPGSGYPMHLPELLAVMKGVAYSARVAVSSPANYQRAKKAVRTAFQKQLDGVGFSFVEILSVCPPNWHLSPVRALKWLEENLIPEFPLGEFKNVTRT